MVGGSLAPCGLGPGESSHCTAASPALRPAALVCPSGPRVLGRALCCLPGEVGWWGGRGEWTLPSRGRRWNSQGLAGRAGDHQPMPSPKEPFGINLLKKEEGSSPHPRFGDTMSEACRCCLNVVVASSLRCDLCLRHEDPSSPSAQLMLLPSFHYLRFSPLPGGLCLP